MISLRIFTTFLLLSGFRFLGFGFESMEVYQRAWRFGFDIDLVFENL